MFIHFLLITLGLANAAVRPHLAFHENRPVLVKGGELPAADRNEDVSSPIFDIPITYNDRVQFWIRYFQTTGRSSFQKWLARSTRYSPFIVDELGKAGLPKDIMYTAMIESGFSPGAESSAAAMGIWQ